MASILNPANKREAHIDQRLHNDEVIWLVSVRPDGHPHAVVVWFLWDGETVLIFSQPKNQKVRNIRDNGHVVLALDNTNGGSDPVTIEGTAELLQSADISTTLEAYTKKYGEGMKGIGLTPEQMAARYSQGIRITPTRVL